MASRQSEPQDLAQVFRILGDPSRLRIIMALSDGEKNVTELCNLLDLSQPTVSRHLSILKMSSFAVARRSGKEMHYSLPSETRRALKAIMDRGEALA